MPRCSTRAQTARRCSLLLLALVAAATDVRAQDPRGLDEIVVTARKRTENLQDVPLSIVAFDARALERSSTDSLFDLANLTPGLDFKSYRSGALGSLTIRGLSQTDITSLQNNVATFFDGVFVSARAGINLSMLDLERVEVVKGPQSALYGHGAFAGAVNFVTKRPPDAPFARLVATVGEDGRLGGTVTFGGPLGERFAGRVSLGHDESDGPYDNGRGGTLGGHEYDTIVASAVFRATDAFEIEAGAYYSDDELGQTPYFELLGNCGTTTNVPIVLGPMQPPTIFPARTTWCGELPSRDTLYAEPSGVGLERTSQFYRLQLQYSGSAFRFTSLSSWAQFEGDGAEDSIRLDPVNDTGLMAVLATYALVPSGNRQYLPQKDTPAAMANKVTDVQQELRFESAGEGPLTWSFGGYYLDSDVEIRGFRRLDLGGVPAGQAPSSLAPMFNAQGVAQTIWSDVRIEQRSLFAAAEYAFTDRIKAGVEARYTWENFERTNFVFFGLPIAAQNVRGEVDSNAFTPRLTFQYRPSDGVMLYAHAGKGVKGGGTNTNVQADVPGEVGFGPESNVTLEFGAKTSWLDGVLTLNGALFHTDWEDVQFRSPSLSMLPNAGLVTRNAAEASSKGLELDLVARPSEGWTLNLGYALSDAKYGSGLVDFGSISRCGQGIPQVTGCDANIGGNQIDRQSKHHVVAGVAYEGAATERLAWFWGVSGSWRSKQFANATNSYWLGARSVFNARLGLQADRWSVMLWGNNLTDDDTPISETSSGRPAFSLLFLPTVFVPEPRQLGVTATYEF